MRDAIKTMLEDELLPVALVRTALLASKAHSDVKKFLLSDFIPTLIKRKVWIGGTEHWVGLQHCVKNYAVSQSVGQNIVEPTYRAILGLPGVQLKSLLTAAPTIKPALSKLLKVFSNQEREEVVSGRWVGLESTNNESGESIIVDNEKSIIMKELLA